MAIALTGAVLLGDDGRTMRYQQRCENCGTLQPGTISMQVPQGSHTTAQSSFNCVKCRSRNEVRIRGQ
jgi:phage terminase large subunit GpA-like protein